MASRLQRLDVDLEKCYENDIDWTLLPEKRREDQNELVVSGKGNSDDDSSTAITAQAIQIASSIVGNCLAQLCALNDRMHVLNHLEGKEEEMNETEQLTREAGGSTNIAAFGRVYRALLLSHGPTAVSLSILIRNVVFKRPCNGLSNKTLTQKVLHDLVSLGLGKTLTFRSTGNKILVTFFKKSSVPDTPDGQKDFMHLLAKCGVDLPSSTTAYNADDEDSDKHNEDFQNRKDNDASPA